MTPLNLVFMGTPGFALPALEALVAAGHRLLAVYTAPPKPAGRGQKESPSPVHRYALQAGLPVFTPLKFKDEQVQREFAAHHADAAVVAAYGLLLPQAVLASPRMGCINIHPSLLPRWRGAAPIQRTVMAGDSETGVVIMRMDAGLDTGDMLLTARCPVAGGTTAGELEDALARMAAGMIVKTLERLSSGGITPVKQPEEGVTYAHKITREDCRIHWNDPAHAIRQKILGLSPSPGAAFIYRGEAIKILRADLLPDASTAKAGEVMDARLAVRCGENALLPQIVQRPGKKPMPVADMLRGYPIAAGEMLE